MFSVVVPTMWKYEPFIKFLEDLVNCDLVYDIVLIDNDRTLTPNFKVLDHRKINKYTPDYNIGVNPAWNYGVRVSKTKNICVMNDDILFDFKLFQKVYPYMHEGTGAICLSGGEEKFQQVPVTNGNIDIVPWESDTSQTYSRFGFGSLFFIPKYNWVDIPQEMYVFYGDDWLLETQIHKKTKNYVINNCFHHTPRATTCIQLQNRDEILQRDKQIYDEHYAQLKNMYS